MHYYERNDRQRRGNAARSRYGSERSIVLSVLFGYDNGASWSERELARFGPHWSEPRVPPRRSKKIINLPISNSNSLVYHSAINRAWSDVEAHITYQGVTTISKPEGRGMAGATKANHCATRPPRDTTSGRKSVNSPGVRGAAVGRAMEYNWDRTNTSTNGSDTWTAPKEPSTQTARKSEANHRSRITWLNIYFEDRPVEHSAGPSTEPSSSVATKFVKASIGFRSKLFKSIPPAELRQWVNQNIWTEGLAFRIRGTMDVRSLIKFVIYALTNSYRAVPDRAEVTSEKLRNVILNMLPSGGSSCPLSDEQVKEIVAQVTATPMDSIEDFDEWTIRSFGHREAEHTQLNTLDADCYPRQSAFQPIININTCKETDV